MLLARPKVSYDRGIMPSMATINLNRAKAIRDIEKLLDQAAVGAEFLSNRKLSRR